MKPIFCSVFYLSTLTIYSDRVEYEQPFTGKKVITAKQIASVDTGSPFRNSVLLETTGGQRYELKAPANVKNLIAETIRSIIA